MHLTTHHFERKFGQVKADEVSLGVANTYWSVPEDIHCKNIQQNDNQHRVAQITDSHNVLVARKDM